MYFVEYSVFDPLKKLCYAYEVIITFNYVKASEKNKNKCICIHVPPYLLYDKYALQIPHTYIIITEYTNQANFT